MLTYGPTLMANCGLCESGPLISDQLINKVKYVATKAKMLLTRTDRRPARSLKKM